jgi:hypothetical protein
MDLVESGNNAVSIERRHPWELARIEVIKRVLRDRVELRAGDIVLDVGCGDSFMAEQLAPLYPGVTFYGIDTAFDEQLLRTFTRKLEVGNVRLFSTLEAAAADIGGAKVSAVLLMDVIEHIQDDVAFLKELQASPLVGPQTRYVVSVPAFGFLFSAHDVILGHYRRYSNRTLEEHLKRAGLEPQLICYFFSSLLLPRLVQVAKEKMLQIAQRRTTQVADWQGSTIRQRFISKVLVWDFCLSWALYRRGIKIPGLSNLAVCRKPA